MYFSQLINYLINNYAHLISDYNYVSLIVFSEKKEEEVNLIVTTASTKPKEISRDNKNSNLVTKWKTNWKNAKGKSTLEGNLAQLRRSS